ncbi:DNA binding domain-containing protein, excisionase family [Palleronia marisminoris]|uniref:PBP superfamily domain protein n=1 Tax=Palleronia marisminoris TaxID=315423 RepID=A0A1Y5TDP6_9RHOB|nr:helix-turn-helix transcriptional regulator [Palleronia marisminoris]SFH32076.1 DNA binding domain-containing protein, excisionase family [Palleronia marisminoris]SLN61363.1 PBP superfamily domain protein [Palleronia marisminoris]
MTDTAFPDHEFLTVKELAELLRVKERKVYDLAASGAVPCSRATGKLLFPSDDIRAWIERAKSGGPGTAAEHTERPPIMLGSHDPLLDWAIRRSRCGLATFHDGSMDGLERFGQGEGVAAGLHIHDELTDSWNAPAVSSAAAGQNAVLVNFAIRRRGLVVRSDVPAPSGLCDLAGRRIVPRQPGSGTDTLFRNLAAREGLDRSSLDVAEVARTEDEAVETVRRGEADAAFGLEAVAKSYGLDFVPIVEEEFALIVDRKAWFEPPMQTLMTFFASDAFRARAEAYGGYDITGLGAVVWNA